MAGTDMSWSGAGAIIASLLSDRYAVIVGSLGASPALGIEAPATSTYEADSSNSQPSPIRPRVRR